MKKSLPTFLKCTNKTNLSLVSTTVLSVYTTAQDMIEPSMISINGHYTQHGCTQYITSINLTPNTLVLGFNSQKIKRLINIRHNTCSVCTIVPTLQCVYHCTYTTVCVPLHLHYSVCIIVPTLQCV